MRHSSQARPTLPSRYPRAVADERNLNDPSYDWLYVEPADRERSRPDEQDPAGRQGPDLEATQPIRRAPGGPADPASSPKPGQPEPTRSFGPSYFPPPQSSSSQSSSSQSSSSQSSGNRAGSRPAEMRYAPPPPVPGGPGAPSRPSPVPRPPLPRRRRRWWLRTILLLILVWVIFLVVVPIVAWTKVAKVDAEPVGARPAATPGTTYLLVGSDSRRGLTTAENKKLGTGGVSVDSGRTDTILLMHLPAGGGPMLLLSIPRDSYVNIPGYGFNKINAAFSIGGPRLLVKTVEGATHVRVDKYVEIGFAGFVRLVDAVGGITICPRQAINDPKADLRVRKGCQHADGRKALGYSRSRAFPKGDIIRTLHQREVVNATARKAASWQSVVFPWRYWRINFAAAESVRVGQNVSPLDMVRFAWAMSHSNNGKKCVVPYSSLGTPTSVGSVVTWDQTKANRLFRLIRADDTKAIRCSAQ
jgi:LCP family protein required for cell wall assembly